MPRGGFRPGAGRKKGSVNRVTGKVRKALSDLIEENVEPARDYLKGVWEKGSGTDKREALLFLTRMAEFAAPKFSRDAGEAPPPVAPVIRVGNTEGLTAQEGAQEASRLYAELVAGTIGDSPEAAEAAAQAISALPQSPVAAPDHAPALVSPAEANVNDEVLREIGGIEELPAAPCVVEIDAQMPERAPPRRPAPLPGDKDFDARRHVVAAEGQAVYVSEPADTVRHGTPRELKAAEAARPVRRTRAPGIALAVGEHVIDGEHVVVEPDPRNPHWTEVHYPLPIGRHVVDGKCIAVTNPRGVTFQLPPPGAA
jgi:hypothetical protein